MALSVTVRFLTALFALQLAKLSARGQEFLRKQGIGNIEAANHTGDEVFHQSLLGGTTQASA